MQIQRHYACYDPTYTCTSSIMLEGSCHCGAIHIAVPTKQPYANHCHCSICYKYGVLWSYYNPKDVTIEHKLDAKETYKCHKKTAEFCRCKTCGCVYAWISLDKDATMMGVNMRMMKEKDLDGVEIREHHKNDS